MFLIFGYICQNLKTVALVFTLNLQGEFCHHKLCLTGNFAPGRRLEWAQTRVVLDLKTFLYHELYGILDLGMSRAV